MDIKLQPKKVFFFLMSVIAVLTTLNLLGIGIIQYGNMPKVEEHLVRLVDFDKERNIPSFYSSLAILLAALILGGISSAERKRGGDYKRWLGLAFLFGFLGLDEAVSIHELLSGPTRTVLNLESTLYLAWVIPYLILAVALGIVYIQFLFRLPSHVRNLFILAAAVFVSGAVGFELLGSSYYASGKASDPLYGLLYTLEELFEMLGIAMFIYGLLLYIETALSPFKINVSLEKVHSKSKATVGERESPLEQALPSYSDVKS